MLRYWREPGVLEGEPRYRTSPRHRDHSTPLPSEGKIPSERSPAPPLLSTPSPPRLPTWVRSDETGGVRQPGPGGRRGWEQSGRTWRLSGLQSARPRPPSRRTSGLSGRPGPGWWPSTGPSLRASPGREPSTCRHGCIVGCPLGARFSEFGVLHQKIMVIGMICIFKI